MNKTRTIRLESVALAISFGLTILVSAGYNPFDLTFKVPDKPTMGQSVNKIYVVDESRCENPDSGINAGRVYLIEGQEKMAKLMKAFKDWQPKDGGGCLCGGPDKHYYCYAEKEQVNYWGLDCDTFLQSNEICPELNGLINPKYPATFLGEPVGYALTASVPIETTEKEIVEIGRKANVTIFYGDWARNSTIEQKNKETASFEALIKVDLKDKGILDSEHNRIMELIRQKASEEERAKVVQETDDKVNAMCYKAYQEWLLNYGIEPSSLIDSQRSGWSSNGGAELKLCLSKIPHSFKKNEQWQNAECNISIKEVNNRTDKEKCKQYYYGITILVPTSDSEKESKRISAAMPMLRNVRCVCERFSTRKEVTLQ
jgi:hypothetical protein